MRIRLTVSTWRATISDTAKDVINDKNARAVRLGAAMADRSTQADDLDVLLRDALRDCASAAPDSPRAWERLRARIESSPPEYPARIVRLHAVPTYWRDELYFFRLTRILV